MFMKNVKEYLDSSVTPFHAVEEAAVMLQEKGYVEKSLADVLAGKVNADNEGKFYVNVYGKTLAAFSYGQKCEGPKLRITAAHTDSPCFHIKPVATLKEKPYFQINTEVYGGPILNTWLDRPLSIAGMVSLRTEDPFKPELKLVDYKKAVATIPNLAIHLNRKINEGVELNKQVDLMPMLGLEGSSTTFIDSLAKEVGTAPENILDFDLYVYLLEEGRKIGLNEEFFQGPRLDNLTSCYAILKGLFEADEKKCECCNTIDKASKTLCVAMLYDHEEIGSMSKQGADSSILKMLLEGVYEGLGKKNELNQDIADGFMLSIDAAHALHPNRPEKYDPTNRAVIGQGIVLKINSKQRYTFDTSAVATVSMLCEQAGIEYQRFTNRSDEVGGTTLGPIISAWLPMRAVDIGVPMLAMHSAAETVGCKDLEDMEKLVERFYC